MAVLVDRPPKILQLARHADQNLTEAPLVAGPRPSPFQFVGEQPAEAKASLADSFVADHDATGGEDGLDIRRLRLKQ